MSTPTHLHPDLVPLLAAPAAHRIAECQVDRWIGYTRAAQVLNHLDQTLESPRCIRMPCVLLVGRSGNGKSSILERFVNRHPVLSTACGVARLPILRFDMPETPDESEMWSTMLWALNTGHREKDSAAHKKRTVKSNLALFQTQMLVIDEFNHLIQSGKRAGDLLAGLKGLSNELRLSIVASGTPEAVNALNLDPQMKSRFEPLVLDRWALDDEYLRFLASYERVLPLAQPSNLIHPDIASAIWGMSGDTIGQTVKVLKAAAIKAISTGTERITPEILAAPDMLRQDRWAHVHERV